MRLKLPKCWKVEDQCLGQLKCVPQPGRQPIVELNGPKSASKKGSVVQTILNHTDIILHNISDNNLNLFVRRSYSEDLWLWINDSARFI